MCMCECMCVCTSRCLCTIATGRVDMCTRDGEEFQGKVNAFKQGFLGCEACQISRKHIYRHLISVK